MQGEKEEHNLEEGVESWNIFTNRIYCAFATLIELASVWWLKPRLSEFSNCLPYFVNRYSILFV